MNIGLDMSKQNGWAELRGCCIYRLDFDATGHDNGHISPSGNSLVCGTVGYGTMIV